MTHKYTSGGSVQIPVQPPHMTAGVAILYSMKYISSHVVFSCFI